MSCFFYEPFGGATLNAAIAHYVYGELLVGKGHTVW
jgi:hypothetical protein